MPRTKVEPITEGDGSELHGTTVGYSSRKCHCSECRRAWAAYHKQMKATRRLKDNDPRHGKYTSYQNYRCKCEKCSQAMREYKRSVKAKETSAGTEITE